VLYADRIIKADYFYAAIETRPVTNLAINQFLEVQPVDAKELVSRTREYAEAVTTLFAGLRRLAGQQPTKEELLVDFGEALRTSAREVRVPVEQIFAACGLMGLQRNAPAVSNQQAVEGVANQAAAEDVSAKPTQSGDAVELDILALQLDLDSQAKDGVQMRPAPELDDSTLVSYQGLSRTADDVAVEMAALSLRGLPSRETASATESVHPIQEAVHELLQVGGMVEVAAAATEEATVGAIEHAVQGAIPNAGLDDAEARAREQEIFDALEAIAGGR